MLEIEFTIDPTSGQHEMHGKDSAGLACDDVAKLARELLGEPGHEHQMKKQLERTRFCATMGAFPTGVTIVTALDGGDEPRGLTCNAFASVSADPPMLLICVDKSSTTLEALKRSGRFAINILAGGRGPLSDKFAGKSPDKFDGIDWVPASNGMPLLHRDAIAHACCDIAHMIDAGDHYVVLGQVTDAQPPAPDQQPLVYFRRRYGVVQVDGGTASGDR